MIRFDPPLSGEEWLLIASYYLVVIMLGLSVGRSVLL